MLHCIKQSINLTNKNIILASPLILFSLLSSLYILFSINGSVINLIIVVVLYTLMLVTFISGWFYMIKSCVVNKNADNTSILIKEFPVGVGEYFLSSALYLIIVFMVFLIMLSAFSFLGMKFIGSVEIEADILSKAMVSAEAFKSFLLTLSEDQLYKLSGWYFLLYMSTALGYLVIMFYAPALFFKNKNPLIAFGIAFKDLFSKNFVKNLLLFLIILISYTLLSIFTTFSGINIVLYFIFTLINLYYIVLVYVLIFEFYFSNYVRIGQFVDTRV